MSENIGEKATGYFNERSQSQQIETALSHEKLGTHSQGDVAAISNACAAALNGPHGAEVARTIQCGVGILGGLITLRIAIDFIERMIRLRMQISV
jgi:hypothetical protein